MIKLMNTTRHEFHRLFPYSYLVQKAPYCQLPIHRLILRMLALSSCCVFAGEVKTVTSAACQLFRTISFFITLTVYQWQRMFVENLESQSIM